MKILTDSARVRTAREMVLEMMLTSGAHNCVAADMAESDWTKNQLKIMDQPWHQVLCPSHGDCRFQDLTIEYDVSIIGALFEKKVFGLATANETNKIHTTCSYCSVRCQQSPHVKNGIIIKKRLLKLHLEGAKYK